MSREPYPGVVPAVARGNGVAMAPGVPVGSVLRGGGASLCYTVLLRGPRSSLALSLSLSLQSGSVWVRRSGPGTASLVRVLLLLLPGEAGQPGAEQHGHGRPSPGAVVRPADVTRPCAGRGRESRGRRGQVEATSSAERVWRVYERAGFVVAVL